MRNSQIHHRSTPIPKLEYTMDRYVLQYFIVRRTNHTSPTFLTHCRTSASIVPLHNSLPFFLDKNRHLFVPTKALFTHVRRSLKGPLIAAILRRAWRIKLLNNGPTLFRNRYTRLCCIIATYPRAICGYIKIYSAR